MEFEMDGDRMREERMEQEAAEEREYERWLDEQYGRQLEEEYHQRREEEDKLSKQHALVLESGRQARLRAVWAKARAGSSPILRTRYT